MDGGSGEGGVGKARTVIVWILPLTSETRESNRRENRTPSRRWAFTRSEGERFNNLLRRHVVQLIEQRGGQAVAPLLSPLCRVVKDSPVGIASTWSERHAAFAAGLGTFSLNDGLITERGIAHRVGSVITDVIVPPTPRHSDDPFRNCLFYRAGACGRCIPRCPVGAISADGHDKEKCYAYVYGELRAYAAECYKVTEAGCGLCQTGVPCESRVP